MENDGYGEWTVGLGKVYVDVLRGELGSTWHLGQGCHCCLGVGWWPLRAAAHSMLGTNPQFATGRRHEQLPGNCCPHLGAPWGL